MNQSETKIDNSGHVFFKNGEFLWMIAHTSFVLS